MLHFSAYTESASTAGSGLAARLAVSFDRWLRVGGKALGMGLGSNGDVGRHEEC